MSSIVELSPSPQSSYGGILLLDTNPKERGLKMVDKSWRAEAKRRWEGKAVRIQGDGQFAFLTLCRVMEVTLLPTRTEAEELKENVDKKACGGDCILHHEIIDLSIISPSN